MFLIPHTKMFLLVFPVKEEIAAEKDEEDEEVEEDDETEEEVR